VNQQFEDSCLVKASSCSKAAATLSRGCSSLLRRRFKRGGPKSLTCTLVLTAGPHRPRRRRRRAAARERLSAPSCAERPGAPRPSRRRGGAFAPQR